MSDSALQLVAKIGNNLRRQTRPNKDSVVKSLREATVALAEIEQPSGAKKKEAAKKLEAAIAPLKETIVKGLLRHRDKDVRLLVAICATEIMRLMAPDPPFEDRDLRDVFKLLVSVFAELDDTVNSLFSKRAKIVEIFAKLKCCVVMLDIDCNDVVLDMFNTFFSVVRENHQQTLINDILSIMAEILNEEVSQPLLDLILRNLVKEGKDTTSASSHLAAFVIKSCTEKLEPLICALLTSCILDRDSVESELKEFYHEIIFRVFECAPQMLNAVIPNLTQELLTDQVDVRIKAVKLIGKLFSLPEHNISRKYDDLFKEFVRRFSDKSVEVRVCALQCTRVCYVTNPTGEESQKLLSSLEGRLRDFDDKVRTQAVIICCDLAMSNLKYFPPSLISQTTERLRDKKIPIRKMALQKLMEVYRYYCNKCSEGHIAITDHFEQIPCKVLMLCYDKDCKEFRSQNMELVLAEDLFPPVLSAEERTRHWIHLFSVFTPLHLKAFNAILSQKQRLQSEMRIYLETRKKEKGNDPEDMQKRYKTLFFKMAVCYADPSHAEECFYKLNQIKVNNIFDSLALLLDESRDARTTGDKFLHTIGEKHEDFVFLRTLSSKCSHNLFSSEHVRCILDFLSSNTTGNNHLEASCAQLLLAIISFFPTLLRGSEAQFQMLLMDTDPINDKLLEVLAKAGKHVSLNLRAFAFVLESACECLNVAGVCKDLGAFSTLKSIVFFSTIHSEIYPFLERVCLDGTRSQSKYAVAAVSALVSDSKLLSSLCKKLVQSLLSERNIPTVLQSIGCLAQHSASTFESQAGRIISYIHQNIFQVDSSDCLSSFDDESACNSSCKPKIYGLKTFVKSFLPHGGTLIKRQVNELWDILSTMLRKGETVDSVTSCESAGACQPCIRLAAAKSVLRLSRKWDFHISPEIFRLTVSMAKDNSPLVRRLYLDKTHKLLKGHAIPSRYACTFAFATSDCFKDLQDDSFKYMTEFIKDHSREAQVHQVSRAQEGLVTSSPAYIVVFLIHLLAHDEDFPREDCRDAELYAQFCCPMFVLLRELVNASNGDGAHAILKDSVLNMICIFRAIKKAEDAIDVQKTYRLHLLADIGHAFVMSTNRSGLSLSDSPGQILLPSSLYKSNDRSLDQSCYDVRFVQRVVNIFKSNISLPSNVIKGDVATGTGHRQKQAQARSAIGADGKKASKKYEVSLGKEVVSSCDSVAAVSSLDDQNVKRNTSLLKKDVCGKKSNNEELSNHPTKCKITCDSSGDIQVVNIVTDSGETLTDGSLKERPIQNKRKKASTDDSVIEVLDMNTNVVARRTRRQKKLNYA